MSVRHAGLAVVACVAAVCTTGVVWAAYVDEAKVGSLLVCDWVNKAYKLLDEAEWYIEKARFTEGSFRLTDARFYLALAIEMSLPNDHQDAKAIREKDKKLSDQIKEWGGDEEAKQVAEAWWDRVWNHHLREVAFPIFDAMKADNPLKVDEMFFLPRYFSRVIMPELEAFKKKYPDPAALADLVRGAGGNLGDGWAFCPPDWRDKPRIPGMIEFITQVHDKLPDFITKSIPAAVNYGKKQLLEQGDQVSKTLSLRALDAARVVLSLQPDHAMAEKIRAKAQASLDKYRAEAGFDINKVRMPQDVNPGDQQLHAQLKAAYERWARNRGYQETVVRVVVTSGWRESSDAWWEGNTLHWGTFRRINGAVAVKKANGECMVLYCIFYRALLAGGKWSDVAVEKITFSEPILEENISK